LHPMQVRYQAAPHTEGEDYSLVSCALEESEHPPPADFPTRTGAQDSKSQLRL
jgi:hypothetical protein